METKENIENLCGGLIDDFIQESRFFTVWNTENVDADTSRHFLVAFDALVKSFPSLIAAGAARMGDEATRTTLAVNLFQECGEGDVTRTHHAIYRKYLATAGIPLSGLKDPDFAIEWRNRLMGYITAGPTVPAALGALAAGEFLAQPALARIFAPIEPLFPSADKEYFTKHLQLETEHVEEITSVIVGRMRSEGDFGQVLEGFKFGLSVWETFFDRLAGHIFEKEPVKK
jgi:pyrroloquinoline quinone (PQQ) biosynthesis protein C